MSYNYTNSSTTSDISFKLFHKLMAKKVREILLVSSPYDAFIMEEDGRIAERIIHEYKGLNLSAPPLISWVSSGKEALEAIDSGDFDLVIIMPYITDIPPRVLARRIKKLKPKIPLYFLANDSGKLLADPWATTSPFIDRTFLWRGNSDLLLAIIKISEDRLNVSADTKQAMVRVIIFVDDSPLYTSSILPILYKEIVLQTQNAIGESLNEEHRLLRMRARPKILIAETFEEAEHLFRQFKDYLLCVISDVRFPVEDELSDDAGISLISMVKTEKPDLPTLILSSEENYRQKAEETASVFLNKNSPSLHGDIRCFFIKYLGFGDFIFQMPDGTEISRVSSIRGMRKVLYSIPDESIHYHGSQNDFSRWLMARAEVQLALKLKPIDVDQFENPAKVKKFLISILRDKSLGLQKGVISDFFPGDFDPEFEFIKIGKGSLGGKARGLAFMSTILKDSGELFEKYPGVSIRIPRTLVISTEGFEAFVHNNNFIKFYDSEVSDEVIEKEFSDGKFPAWLSHDLSLFLSEVRYPLAIRSSSLLEDSQFRPCAGAFKTFMIPNSHYKHSVRLKELILAIKQVFASTFLKSAKAFTQGSVFRIEEDKMAIIIQELIGQENNGYYYPSISGVAQSHNFYPVSHMGADDGIAFLSIGFGKFVVEGGKSLRFSPKYPKLLPQFSKVKDIMENSQKDFYAIKLDNGGEPFLKDLEKLYINDCSSHNSVQKLSSTYFPDENAIRDTAPISGIPVLTFASILKYNLFPLPKIISDLLALGKKGMGCDIEIEFAATIPDKDNKVPEFSLLQIRPMAVCRQDMDVEISIEDIQNAFCFSTKAMGNNQQTDITDIVFIVPERFNTTDTIDIVSEIRAFNHELTRSGKKFLLVGPGRWGSSDRWLGIPVQWNDISGANTIIETTATDLNAEPSYGAHFFHNITSIGINYLTITDKGNDFIDWNWLEQQPFESETDYVRHVKLKKSILLKLDGLNSTAVIIKE